MQRAWIILKPALLPWSVEKLSSMKLAPGAKKGWGLLLQVTEKRLLSFLIRDALSSVPLSLWQGPCLCILASQPAAAIPPALHTPLTCQFGASRNQRGNHRGTECPGMAQGPCVLAGLQGWAFKAADYKWQEGVLLAHPVHCGSGCRRQLWHLSSYPWRRHGETHSAS